MLLEGILAEIMATFKPKLYRNYIIINQKSKSLWYVEIKKAFYGLLRSAIMFYLNLVKDLEDFGFEINTYDSCVATMMINGQHMTLTCHVDYIKVSHKDPLQVKNFTAYLSLFDGKNIKVTHGKVHDYLVM